MYRAVWGLALRVVILAELPRTRETVLLRLLASGQVLSQALAETRAGALLTVLRVRGVPVPDAARERILVQKDPEQLERWLEKAAVASSIAEVLDEPS